MILELNEFEKLCESTFNSLFQGAKQENGAKFLTSLLTIYYDQNSGLDTINYTVDYEFEELLDLIRGFSGFEESDELGLDIKVRLFLFIYCHVIEIDFIYLVLNNMLNTIRGEDYSTIIFLLENLARNFSFFS